MAFDADAFRAAHRPWEFTVGGRRHVARPVSVPAVLAFQDAARRATTPAQEDRALLVLLRRAFPWRPSYLAYGDPVRLLLNLEPAAREEALKDFFQCLGGKSVPIPPLPTSGTDSSSRTPTPPAA